MMDVEAPKSSFGDNANAGSNATTGTSSSFHALPETGEANGIGINTATEQKPAPASGGSSLNVEGKESATNTSPTRWYLGKTKRAIVKIIYLSFFAILGALLRIVLAQLFGEECKNPGTVGWLKAGQPLCVTADGETSVEGGIIFADLPANLLGSFIMGLMQSTSVMGLPKSMPIAWLSSKNPFQSWHTIHLAIKTGFCGSLTTYSSWNSEMVIMMFGAASDRPSLSLFFRALLGYLIGVETALASFVLGVNIASGIHSRINPDLHIEYLETTKKKEMGVHINPSLPDFERRFLPDFNMYEYQEYIDPDMVEPLVRWRTSTAKHRRVGDDLLPILVDIESQALVAGERVDLQLCVTAQQAGWDIEALETWVVNRRTYYPLSPYSSFEGFEEDFRFLPAFAMFATVMTILLLLLLSLHQEDAYSITYRTMVYAALFAPSGALLRWKLSKWNGTLAGNYSWLPLGTLMANLIGSIVSATVIGTEYRLGVGGGFWMGGTLRAIKVGFAGSLSTVSTFISEVSAFLKSPNPVKGYLYTFVSLGMSFVCASICYGIIVSGVDDGDEEVE